MDAEYEILIVGGGAAGRSGALTLGRVGRSVLLIDAGRPRNSAASRAHGFLGHDGISAPRFREVTSDELRAYPDVTVHEGTVAELKAAPDEPFTARLAGGERVSAARVLLATGLRDLLPEVPGLADAWGRSVLHCVYCHGWEVRGRPLAVLGSRKTDVLLALHLRRISAEVTLFAPEGAGFQAEVERAARDGGVPLSIYRRYV